MTEATAGDGFVAFFRRYTRSWLHAVATAVLTAFGTLTVVHRGFAALAVAAYVLPPVALYLTRSRRASRAPRTEEETFRQRAGSGALEEDGDRETGVSAGTANESGSRPEPGSEPGSEPEPEIGFEPQSEPGSGFGSESKPESDPPSEAGSEHGGSATWTSVDTPTDVTLFDVTVTEAGAYAVGAAGVVLADAGDGWRTVLTAGPGTDSNALRGVDAPADGDAVWIAGDGGAVGRLDVGTGRHVDFSAPRDRTDAWTDVAVGGPVDDELVLLTNGSGEVLRGRYREGEIAWDAPVKPGGGSSLSGVALRDGSVGYLCDTNDGVFETDDAGETFRRIGLESAGGTLTAVATDGVVEGARDDGPTVAVVADDGVLHRRVDGTWTPVRLGKDALAAVGLGDGGGGLACGGGAVYERPAGSEGGAGWNRAILPGPGPFGGTALGPGRVQGPERAVVVGADGAIVERR